MKDVARILPELTIDQLFFYWLQVRARTLARHLTAIIIFFETLVLLLLSHDLLQLR